MWKRGVAGARGDLVVGVLKNEEIDAFTEKGINGSFPVTQSAIILG